ncbi:HipA N-terminal domain-containing protein [Roseateles sp. L2-2]|uniref:HipA N-terminal domain-containing protein n=1 Tax=Roseateles sp. L2-2 TaxID=3422597 RepID=UPI003D36A8C8
MAELHLWMNGLHVGVWTVQRGGTSVLRYFPSWRDSPHGRALSLSLPFNTPLEHRGEVVDNYFQNLLPDSHVIRARLKARFSTPTEDPFDLLSAIGRDCVGALQVLPPEQSPDGWDRIEAEPLDEPAVARVLRAATSSRGPGWVDEDDELRVSLAGAQEKTALLRMGKTWYLPRGATPTTHILKLPLGLVGNMKADMTESVENEWICAQLLRELGPPGGRSPAARVAMPRSS